MNLPTPRGGSVSVTCTGCNTSMTPTSRGWDMQGTWREVTLDCRTLTCPSPSRIRLRWEKTP